jgi:hypothetical protein
MEKKSIADIVSILLLLLFAYTATSKMLDYDKFVFQMKLAPLPLMQWAAPTLGWLMPLIELIIAGMLVIGLLHYPYRLTGIYAALILLIVFEIYISFMLLSGKNLPCTCGGIISKMTWTQHLIFNGLFIIISTLAIVTSKATLFEPILKMVRRYNKIFHAR